MGVRGLWSLLESYGDVIHPEEMRGKRVAVDASVWVMQFRSTTQASGGKSVENQLLCGFLQRVLKMLYYGVEPVFVFDGVASLSKAKEQARREVRSLELRQRYLSRQAKAILTEQRATGLLLSSTRPSPLLTNGCPEIMFDQTNVSETSEEHQTIAAYNNDHRKNSVTPLSSLIRCVRTRLRQREGPYSLKASDGADSREDEPQTTTYIPSKDIMDMKNRSNHISLVSCSRKRPRRPSLVGKGSPCACTASSTRSTSFFLTEAALFLKGRNEKEGVAAVNTLALSSSSLFMGKRVALQSQQADEVGILQEENRGDTAPHYVVSESSSQCTSLSRCSSSESEERERNPGSRSSVSSVRTSSRSPSVEIVHLSNGSKMHHSSDTLTSESIHDDPNVLGPMTRGFIFSPLFHPPGPSLPTADIPPSAVSIEASAYKYSGGADDEHLQERHTSLQSCRSSETVLSRMSVSLESENEEDYTTWKSFLDSSCWSPLDHKVEHANASEATREETDGDGSGETKEPINSSELRALNEKLVVEALKVHKGFPRWDTHALNVAERKMQHANQCRDINTIDAPPFHDTIRIDDGPQLPFTQAKYGDPQDVAYFLEGETKTDVAAQMPIENSFTTTGGYATVEQNHNRLAQPAGGVPFELLDIVQLLDYCGVPFILSPMEADVECARLSQCGIVDAVFTEDSDVMVHGAKVVWRGFFSGSKSVTEYRRDVLAAHGISHAVLVALATILGCDYDDGIPGIGLIGALTILVTCWNPHTTLSSAGEILGLLSRWKHLVQDSAPPTSWASDSEVYGENMSILQFQLLRKHFATWKQHLSGSRSFPSESLVHFFCSAWCENTEQTQCDLVAVPFETRAPDWSNLRKFSYSHGLFSASQTLLQQFHLVERTLVKRGEDNNENLVNVKKIARHIKSVSKSDLHDPRENPSQVEQHFLNRGKKERKMNGMRSVLVQLLADLQCKRE